jgi:hypothetical protein
MSARDTDLFKKLRKRLPDATNAQLETLVWHEFLKPINRITYSTVPQPKRDWYQRPEYDHKPSIYNQSVLTEQLEECVAENDTDKLRQLALYIIEEKNHLAPMLFTIMTTYPQFEAYRDLYKKLSILS